MTDATTVITSVAASPGEFRIGRAFSRTFTLLSRNFPIYFVVAAVGSVPLMLFQKTSIPLIDDSVTLSLIAWILMLLLGPLAQAIVLHVAFQDMRGGLVSLTEAVRSVVGRLLPLIGLAICMGVAIAVGVLLLIVPALILLTMWYVAYSACIIERRGVFASMERSGALTKGHRWAIFGTWLLLAITGAILGAVVSALIGLSESSGLVMAGSLAWTALVSAFGIVFAVVVYHDLRVAKEGIDTRQITAVFE
ncbi:MAG: hypothetical protein JO328_01545 [Hyphomicrobiales bacterium]|nr:hypothetical protein [Hyphomicrobiales bacterium]MBV8823773.1 hypothetical protein [Hyphomicrobiales bacterium]